jgi:hypothetical protein
MNLLIEVPRRMHENCGEQSGAPYRSRLRTARPQTSIPRDLASGACAAWADHDGKLSVFGTHDYIAGRSRDGRHRSIPPDAQSRCPRNFTALLAAVNLHDFDSFLGSTFNTETAKGA